MPIRAAAFRRQVQHQPERIDVRRATRILSRVGHRTAHLAAVKVTDDSIAPGEDAEAGDIGVFGADVGAGVVAGHIGHEWKIGEAALLLVREQPIDR